MPIKGLDEWESFTIGDTPEVEETSIDNNPIPTYRPLKDLSPEPEYGVKEKRAPRTISRRELYTKKQSSPTRHGGMITKTSKGEFVTLRIEDLQIAIKNVIRNPTTQKGMPEDEARQMAMHVMNFFGYHERIIDNILEPEDRDAFYMLEDVGLLTTEREETTLYDGREWRIHYWLFKKDTILGLARGHSEEDAKIEEAKSIYEEMPEDAWRTRENGVKT